MVVTKSRTAKTQPNNSSFMTFGNTTFWNLMHTITNVIKKLYKKVVVTKSHTVNTSKKLCYEKRKKLNQFSTAKLALHLSF